MLMNLQLKQYQDEKVEELKNKLNELLELDGNKLCIFEAPTGSGKTIMAGELLKRLVDPLDREDGKQFSFRARSKITSTISSHLHAIFV